MTPSSDTDSAPHRESASRAERESAQRSESAGAQRSEREAARREIAVALSHDPNHPDLPRVTASGQGAVARQILEIAFARGIKVREDANLAEVLAAVDVDCEIPLAAFAAVAEILSYVYRAQGAARGGETPGASEP